MFKKILIANRGEIACRIIKSAKRMGIKTVAVYSEVDSRSLHVEIADEAVLIGPPTAKKSYLNKSNIFAAVNKTGADAVHPGYGFLSENASFAKSLQELNIKFIGPHPKAISLMGDKIKSKKIAVSAGVNTIPGYGGAIVGLTDAIKEASKIGYPIMLKASAGGGGKGIRIANNDEECREGLIRTQGEAANAFGDDRVFIEKYIENPRHIEIQILADTKGNTVYLHERECSIQRRHQKIIEEAPSSFLDDETRLAMGEQAVALAKAVNYCSAGTVEFIVDENKNFYFLEMNTRLQVEHPVTENITGIDIVEWMIRIAAGETLTFVQNEIPLNGWSIESRIYAENPSCDFMPSSGRLKTFRPPNENKAIRVDTGVKEGGEVSVHYDPMIAKLISYGSTRKEAVNLMSEALDEFLLKGVSNNINFLASIMTHPCFIDGNINTNFISDIYPLGFNPHHLIYEDLFICVAAAMHQANHERAMMISGQASNQGSYKNSVNWVVKVNNSSYSAKVILADSGYHITLYKKEYFLDSNWKLGDELFQGHLGEKKFCMQVEKNTSMYRLTYKGSVNDFLVLDADVARLQVPTSRIKKSNQNASLLSPLPGILLSVAVSEGQIVKVGDKLAVVESMKMENVLRAKFNCKVSAIKVLPGDILSVGQIILEFKY